jgi:hypothetical protein
VDRRVHCAEPEGPDWRVHQRVLIRTDRVILLAFWHLAGVHGLRLADFDYYYYYYYYSICEAKRGYCLYCLHHSPETPQQWLLSPQRRLWNISQNSYITVTEQKYCSSTKRDL